MPRSVTPIEAARRLAENPDCLYLDVRTPQEYSAGHPPGALNIPIFLADPATGQMFPNPEFTFVVQAVLVPAAFVFVGCASGRRSQHAIITLGDFGYVKLANVDGGFSGQREPSGRLMQAGWCQCDLPIETGDGGDNGWESLRER